MQEQKIPVTVVVNSDGVKEYEKELDKVAEKNEAAFNPKKELKQATIELQKAQAAFGEYSKEALQAAKRVAEVRDRIQEARETADLFDPGKKFQVFTNAIGQVANGYQAVQGAIGLLGVESKKVEEQLLKVQSAMAFSQGLSGLADSAKDFQRLGSIIKNQVAGAFSTLKNAIISTGIGALIVALGVIVANWDKIKAKISGVSLEQEKLNKDSEANVKAQKEKLDSIGGQENILKLQGKSERDILNLKIKQTDEVIKATEASIVNQEQTLKLQIEAEKRNKSILEGILKFLVAPTQLVVDLLSRAAKLLGVDFEFDISKFVSGLVFDPAQVEADGEAALAASRKALENLKNQRAGFVLSVRELDKQAAQKAQQEEEDREKRRLERLKDLRKDEEKAKEDQAEKDKKRREQEEQEEKDRRKRVLEMAQESVNRNIAIQAELAAKKKEYDEQNLMREQLTRDSLAKTGEAFNTLSDIFGKQTAAGKALSIASALINTYLGITQIWANKTVLPEPAGTIQKVAATVAAAASGFAAVRNIVKTPVPGGGGGGGGSVPAGATAPIAPQSQVPTQTVTQLDQGSINQLGNAMGRAYVVESDVTNQQERIRRISRAARLG